MTSAANALLASSQSDRPPSTTALPLTRSQAATAQATVRGASTRARSGGCPGGCVGPGDADQGGVACRRGRGLAGLCGGAAAPGDRRGDLHQRLPPGGFRCRRRADRSRHRITAPYHQDSGKKRPGPTRALPNVIGAWADEIDDTTLFDNRMISVRSDEDAPGSVLLGGSPSWPIRPRAAATGFSSCAPTLCARAKPVAAVPVPQPGAGLSDRG